MGCDIDMIVQVKGNNGWTKVPFKEAVDYRNYSLFAVLANCRNFYEGFIPIAEPKGMPPEPGDLSEDFECELNHSTTWLTLSEILAYNWEQPIKTTMYEMTQWQESDKEDGPPQGWREPPQGYIVLTLEEYKARKEVGEQFPTDYISKPQYVVKIEGSWPVRAYMPHFYDEVIPLLKELDPNPENVRIVCTFNS